jgi:hypothetical protein
MFEIRRYAVDLGMANPVLSRIPRQWEVSNLVPVDVIVQMKEYTQARSCRKSMCFLPRPADDILLCVNELSEQVWR